MVENTILFIHGDGRLVMSLGGRTCAEREEE